MTSLSPNMSRRRLLQLFGIGTVATTGAVSLSACRAGGGDTGRDGTFVYAYDFDKSSQNFNVIVPDTTLLLAAPISELYYPRCALRNWETDEWQYMLAESSEWQDKTLVITPRKGVEWSDGSKLGIDDFVGSFAERKLNVAPGVDGWPNVTKIEKDGETVKVTFDKIFPGIEYEVMRTRIHASSRYGEELEKAVTLFEDGVRNGDKKQQAYVTELGKLKFDDMLSCGPFIIEADKVSDTRVTMKKNKGGLFADKVNFKKIHVEKASNDEAAQLVAERKVDYITHVLGPAERKQLKGTEGLKEFKFDDQQGIGLMLNNKSNPEFADVRVRKALMHIINNEEVGKIALGKGGFFVPKYAAGCADAQAEEVLGTDVSKLDPYEYDPDKAEQYLEEAGWKKKGDVWETKEGKPAEYEILAVNGWNDFDATAKQVAEQWNNFGIKTTTKNAEESSIWGIWPAGDYQVAVRQWGNPFHPEMFGAWQMAWFTDNNRTKDEPGMSLDTAKVDSKTYGEVDVEEIYDVAHTSDDDAKRKEAHAKLATIFNETLPRLPVIGFVRLSYGVEGMGVDKFVTDKSLAENDIYRDNPVMMSILKGKTGAA